MVWWHAKGGRSTGCGGVTFAGARGGVQEVKDTHGSTDPCGSALHGPSPRFHVVCGSTRDETWWSSDGLPIGSYTEF